MGTNTAGRLRVGDLAAAVDVSTDTIRYYERAGLLPAPQRTPGGYRAYGDEAIDRLRFIQGAQRLGLRLDDIRDLLAVRDTGMCPCEPAEQHLRRRLAELDAQTFVSKTSRSASGGSRSARRKPAVAAAADATGCGSPSAPVIHRG